MRLFLPVLFLISIVTQTVAQSKENLVLLPDHATTVFPLHHTFSCLTDPSRQLTFNDIQSPEHASRFRPLSSVTDTEVPIHWIRFSLSNQLSADSVLYASIPFTDNIQLYQLIPGGGIKIENTGDLTPIPQRSVPNGQTVFVTLYVPYGQTRTFFLRLESSTHISQQFKHVSLQKVELYPRALYQQRFIDNRIFQALFYGACLIMLLYNTFMAVVLRSRSYFFYVSYLFLLVLFFASNNGYLAEWLLPQSPRVDLYIRFLTTPLLLLLYLLFSRTYLMSVSQAPGFHRMTNYVLWALPLIGLVMIAGYWSLGRTLLVLLTLLSLLLVFAMAIKALKRGYTPAGYFLAANALLLTGGIAFALQRVFTVVSNPITQYGIQIGSVLELAIFSLGLADRINVIQKKLIEKQLENERLERKRETELKQLAEDKNRELAEKVMERTAEIVAQKEEIQAQNEKLEQNFLELEVAQEIIRQKNTALSRMNQVLEEKVKLRTQELEFTNTALQKSNAELDRFIYRTSHDIKGPLARLQGLSYVALLEVTDADARNYFTMLLTEAKNLNYILARLSTIYDIKHQQLHYESIRFKPLINEITEELCTTDNHIGVCIRAVIDTTNFISDAALVRFIIKNLLENALKFQQKSDDRTGFVSVHIQHDEGTLSIKVSDNGIGIAEEDMPTIFDMFSRAARIHKTAGLGLYMTRLSVERLGGSIHLLPSTENLTVFEVKIPASQMSDLELPLSATIANYV